MQVLDTPLSPQEFAAEINTACRGVFVPVEIVEIDREGNLTSMKIKTTRPNGHVHYWNWHDMGCSLTLRFASRIAMKFIEEYKGQGPISTLAAETHDSSMALSFAEFAAAIEAEFKRDDVPMQLMEVSRNDETNRVRIRARHSDGWNDLAEINNGIMSLKAARSFVYTALALYRRMLPTKGTQAMAEPKNQDAEITLSEFGKALLEKLSDLGMTAKVESVGYKSGNRTLTIQYAWFESRPNRIDGWKAFKLEIADCIPSFETVNQAAEDIRVLYESQTAAMIPGQPAT